MKYENKIVKGIALLLNILAFIPIVVLQYFTYRILTYNDGLAMNYVPIRMIVFVEIGIALVILIPFLIKKTKAGTIISIIMSLVVLIAAIAANMWIVYNDEDIKGLLEKSEHTLDTIVYNSKLSKNEYGVYVLKDDKAVSIEDAADYEFAYNNRIGMEEAEQVIANLNETFGGAINAISYNYTQEMVDDLYSGKVRAIILNNSLIELIESIGDSSDDDTNNGDYADFTSKIKCIYTYEVSKVVQQEEKTKDVTKDCFNVYISGIDTTGSVMAQSRSDVNIIMSINPVTYQILLISTPRDYYVELSNSNGVKDKLTHAGLYGIDVSKATLEMLYDNMKIDYYVRMNFTGFTEIINALGGIDINSDYSFSAKGYSFNSGMNYNVRGDAALVFARERKSFASGDRQRGKNQMEVIKAVISKCASPSILNNYETLLSSVSESFQTDMPKESIQKLVKFQLARTPEWNVVTYSVSGTGQSNYTYSIPGARSYVMVPDEATVTEAKNLLNNVAKGMNLSALQEESGSNY